MSDFIGYMIVAIGFYLYFFGIKIPKISIATEKHENQKTDKPTSRKSHPYRSNINKPKATTPSNSKIEVKTKALVHDDEEVYSMYFDVVGESFKNEDGSSRQQIIEDYVEELEPVHLKFYTYKGATACGVYADPSHTKQVGNIPKDEVEELYELVTSGATIEPRFYEKKGGTNGYKFGVTIEILVKDD